MSYGNVSVTKREHDPDGRAGEVMVEARGATAGGDPFEARGATAGGDPFEALGDPSRREILRLLSSGDKPVSQLAAALPISRPAVSRHLRVLKDAGMVAEQPQGTRRIYRLREEGLQAIQAYLENVWGEAAARFRLLAENTGQEREP